MPIYADLEPATGGIPLAPEGSPPGALAGVPGTVQYGDMLLGGPTAAQWRELHGWRNLPDPDTSDTMRPQSHGVYPGEVFGGPAVVTFTCLVRGTPDAKLRALATLEDHTRMDGVERPLVVDDGGGPWLRYARVIAREIPQEVHFRHGPVECSIQWLCADPRRYSPAQVSRTVRMPSSVGGLDYPVEYPTDYGTFNGGTVALANDGNTAAPMVATFRGPLVDPTLTGGGWRLGFNLTLAAGETLVVDTLDGTALLNGSTDRLYTITNRSSPIERVQLLPGRTDVSLAASGGDGYVTVQYRHARM